MLSTDGSRVFFSNPIVLYSYSLNLVQSTFCHIDLRVQSFQQARKASSRTRVFVFAKKTCAFVCIGTHNTSKNAICDPSVGSTSFKQVNQNTSCVLLRMQRYYCLLVFFFYHHLLRMQRYCLKQRTRKKLQ